MDECKLTQEQLSNRVAKKRSTITNYLRLLKLPVEIQQGIKQGKITMGHARAIINAGDEKVQLKIYQQILDEGLSVRQVEELARKKDAEKSPKSKKPEPFTPVENEDTERTKTFKLYGDKLSSIINHPIQIQQGKEGRGRIMIEFENDEQLEKIIEFFDK
jgi:ParB family chromosome partitioning protein